MKHSPVTDRVFRIIVCIIAGGVLLGCNRRPITPSEDVVTNNFLMCLWTGQYPAAQRLLSPRARKAISVKALHTSWQKMESKRGGVTSLSLNIPSYIMYMDGSADLTWDVIGQKGKGKGSVSFHTVPKGAGCSIDKVTFVP